MSPKASPKNSVNRNVVGFYFTEADKLALARLQKITKVSRSQTIRLALRALAESLPRK